MVGYVLKNLIIKKLKTPKKISCSITHIKYKIHNNVCGWVKGFNKYLWGRGLGITERHRVAHGGGGVKNYLNGP
jgi:hypothetical protein